MQRFFLPFPLGAALLLAAATSPLTAQDERVVAYLDSWDNRPNYVAGDTEFEQSESPANTRRGTVLWLELNKGTSPKQASRQSLDGTFGPATDLLNWEDVPVAPDTMTSSALRINDGEQVDLIFTNSSGGPVTLARFLFDYGRSNSNSPPTIQVRLIDGEGQSTILLTDSTTPVTGSIGTYQNYAIDLAAYTIPPEATFTLRFVVGGGGTGGNLDNTALTAIRPRAVPSPQPRFLLAEGAPRLTVPSETGFAYQLEASPNLQSWQSVGDPVPGTGSDLTFTPAAVLPEQSFFRLTLRAGEP